MWRFEKKLVILHSNINKTRTQTREKYKIESSNSKIQRRQHLLGG